MHSADIFICLLYTIGSTQYRLSIMETGNTMTATSSGCECIFLWIVLCGRIMLTDSLATAEAEFLTFSEVKVK